MSAYFGIHLGGLVGDVAEAFAEDPHSPRNVPLAATVPAAAVLSPGRPMRVHRDGPIPLDGAGLVWPEAAHPTAVLERPATGRIPLPYLWAGLLGGEDGISSRQPAERPEKALALHARGALPREAADSAQIALIIPNELDEGRQQRLLDACKAEGLDAALLWRPVAAAFAWLERFHRGLLQAHDQDEQLGRLLCVHLGLDGCEATWLNLILRPGSQWIRPARQRPRTSTLDPGRARRWVDDSVQRAVSESQSADVHDAWRATWASPTLLSVLEGRTGLPSLEGYGFDEGLTDRVRKALVSNRTGRMHPLLEWAQQVALGNFPTEPGTAETLGAIVTGELAATPGDRGLLGEQVASVLGVRHTRVLCEQSAELPAGSLARSAATYRARRAAKQPTYLDTLPQMEVLLEERARPVWRSLLKEDEQYVEGGRVWQRKPPLGGLSLKANESRFKLYLWVEGEEETRHAEFPLVQPPEWRMPVALEAQIEPAGGRARVELKSLGERAAAGLPVRLDWELAQPSGSSREHTIRTYPLKCPRIQPKQAWDGAWYKVEEAIRSFRRTGNLRGVRTALNQSHQARQSMGVQGNEEGISMWRPIGADGFLHENQRAHQDELAAFLEELAEGQVHARGFDPTALACLGYGCAKGVAVDALVDRMLAVPYLQAEQAYFLAGCARTPAHMSGFVGHLRRYFDGAATGFSDIVKSVGYMLQWREYALDEVSSSDALAIVAGCAKVLERVVKPSRDAIREYRRRLQLKERHALVLIAFMLRRRIVDEAFLSPQLQPAIWIKELLGHAVYRLSGDCSPGERLSVIGGMVKMPTLLEQVSKYIDEEGTGTLVAD